MTVGVTYTGDAIEGVEIDNLGLCRPEVDHGRAAYPLYEYDTIIINPASYTHFLFGKAGEFSNEPNELGKLKRQNDRYDLDSAFDSEDRCKEMEAAIADGATVVWCLSEPKRMNFFGYRETHLGFVTPKATSFVKRSGLLVKKGRRFGLVGSDTPFARYFDVLSRTGGWTLCLSDPGESEGYASIAATPEGYSLGGQVTLGATKGWLLTPPTSQEAENQLVRDSLAVEKPDPVHEKYHGIFLSHTGTDKPFVRQLRRDLLARGVEHVWLDEAEINIGDSLIAKIEEGIKLSRFIAVVLSKKSINAPWVKKELDIAMNREISTGEVVVLPLLYEDCELPEFLKGKLYADFSKPQEYEDILAKLLRRLRIA
ncbi:toll/interleukin-1 receptor domain-containing protein [Neoroseomonas soli]|uniref:toll/interleukin-1 receptor domain-containing protein n=1 Tax=Neoroseomonas soli TaxID=1081025 RepID=UPI001BAB8E9C|nr:toll/interleukin-1 receptor domain-containing protein [Neoroseomonas soli]